MSERLPESQSFNAGLEPPRPPRQIYILYFKWIGLSHPYTGQTFFTIWQKFEILPAHIKSKIEECFGLTSWYLEQQLAGVTLVQR